VFTLDFLCAAASEKRFLIQA